MFKRPQILVLALVSMSFATLLFAPAQASAATLSEDAEKFIRYRAIHGCLTTKDLGKKSPTEVGKGDWWSAGVANTLHRDIGAALLTNDDTNDLSCEQGDSFIADSAKRLGFANAGAMWCSIQPNAYRDTGGSGANDFEKCTTGSGNFDASGSEDQQASQFTEGIKNYSSISSGFPFEPSGAVRYHIYLETFKKFCEPTREKDYVESTDKTLRDSTEYVVVNEVVLENGEPKIIRALYKVGVDDGEKHKVKGVWSQPGGDTYDLSCAELAGKTYDFDDEYGVYLVANPEEAESIDSSTAASNEPVCSAGALGWMICPAINFIGEMNDAVYSVVENMLYIDPVTVEIGGPLYDTWTKFRDIANVLFVAFFLIIVFSQATSVGLSSYGVKKLLPRVLAAAVLVNISFFICQIALDLSNIVGVGIAGLVDSMRSGATVDIDAISWSTLIAGALGAGAAVAGIGVVLAAGSMSAMLAMMLPFMVTALFAIVTAIAVLIARQVIIILLIALSPLAFVALILPNTHKYFQLWQNTFTTMLVMFPLIALLFAGSQLAANIVLTTSTTSDGIGFFALLAAICMMFIPLFGVPYIVKFSGGAIGRIAGLVNNPNKGPVDALRKRAEGYRDYKKDQAQIRNASGEHGNGIGGFARRNTFGRSSRRVARRDAIRQSTKREAGEATSGYIAEEAINNTRFGERMAGGAAYQGANMQTALRRVQAQGIAQQRKESRERAAAIQQRFQHDNLDLNGLETAYAQAAARGDYETMSAAMNESSRQGAAGRDKTAKMITSYAVQGNATTGETAEQVRGEVARSVYELSVNGRPDIVKGGMSGAGTWNLKDVGELSTELKASLDGDVLQAAITNGKISQPEAERIVTTNLKDKVENAALVKQLEQIAYSNGTPPPTPPTPGGGGTP